jgi:hypothetical protein
VDWRSKARLNLEDGSISLDICHGSDSVKSRVQLMSVPKKQLAGTPNGSIPGMLRLRAFRRPVRTPASPLRRRGSLAAGGPSRCFRPLPQLVHASAPFIKSSTEPAWGLDRTEICLSFVLLPWLLSDWRQAVTAAEQQDHALGNRVMT